MSKAYFIDAGLVEAEDLVTGAKILGPPAIARGLASRIRFSGQINRPEAYDVLQHSIRTSECAGVIADGIYCVTDSDPLEKRVLANLIRAECSLWGLLHDSSEAVLSDVAAPIKRTKQMKGFRDVEQELLKKYQQHYLPSLWRKGTYQEASEFRRTFVDTVVHIADVVRLNLEATMLLPEEASWNIADTTVTPGIRPFLDKEMFRHIRQKTDPTAWFCATRPVDHFVGQVNKLVACVENAHSEAIRMKVLSNVTLWRGFGI